MREIKTKKTKNKSKHNYRDSFPSSKIYTSKNNNTSNIYSMNNIRKNSTRYSYCETKKAQKKEHPWMLYDRIILSSHKIA